MQQWTVGDVGDASLVRHPATGLCLSLQPAADSTQAVGLQPCDRATRWVFRRSVSRLQRSRRARTHARTHAHAHTHARTPCTYLAPGGRASWPSRRVEVRWRAAWTSITGRWRAFARAASPAPSLLAARCLLLELRPTVRCRRQPSVERGERRCNGSSGPCAPPTLVCAGAHRRRLFLPRAGRQRLRQPALRAEWRASNTHRWRRAATPERECERPPVPQPQRSQDQRLRDGALVPRRRAHGRRPRRQGTRGGNVR